MPYLEVDLDAIKGAQLAAGVLGLPLPQVLGGLTLLWAHAWQRQEDHVSPVILEGLFASPHPRLGEALEAGGFLERVGDLWRVRGSERYLRITEARRKGALATNAKRALQRRLSVAPASLERRSTPSHRSTDSPSHRKEEEATASEASPSDPTRTVSDAGLPVKAPPPPPPPPPGSPVPIPEAEASAGRAPRAGGPQASEITPGRTICREAPQVTAVGKSSLLGQMQASGGQPAAEPDTPKPPREPTELQKQADEVLRYYAKARGLPPKFDRTDWAIVTRALKVFAVADLKLAIDGVERDSWPGRADQDGLRFILGAADCTRKFMKLGRDGPRSPQIVRPGGLAKVNETNRGPVGLRNPPPQTGAKPNGP